MVDASFVSRDNVVKKIIFFRGEPLQKLQACPYALLLVLVGQIWGNLSGTAKYSEQCDERFRTTQYVCCPESTPPHELCSNLLMFSQLQPRLHVSSRGQFSKQVVIICLPTTSAVSGGWLKLHSYPSHVLKLHD